ncbi:glycosyltransferase family 2 protein [Salipiger sp. P9]|uniref:glycosyltransferase family 2 protein n=1 Tax=Salipiger pentaromativorans TaxID=2943193 RepID=UPI0021585AF8|nr:glycosyltransferase family 2 protein [Salipiger pentaromativorans]MCR8549780.1 glycosyltransferase family 2 protein [Salipiger pentaromativorans]
MSDSGWSVVSTCAEPKKLVEAFVAHHLAQGAEEIFLFFDDPSDGLAKVFSGVPRVVCIECDESFWNLSRPKKGRPSGHRQRQTHNAELAARKLCKSDWIAHIDVDEFLLPRAAGSISNMLKAVPSEIDAVRVLPAERMFLECPTPGQLSFDGIFKLKPEWSSGWGEELYGELGIFFRNGFQGHEVGKSFKRCKNRTARFNIHFVRKDGENIPEVTISQNEAVLLHFFPSSIEDWRDKYERRIDDKAYFETMPEQAKRRYSLYGLAREEGGSVAVRELFETLNVLSEDSQVVRKNPDQFFKPHLDFKTNVENLVSPYVTSGKEFQHMSAPSDEAIPEDQKIFQIGMNRGGTKEICAMFGRRGMTYAHWDHGRLAKNLKDAIERNAKPFIGYEQYQLLSDISFGSKGENIYDGFYDFEYILRHFPSSIFILNYRPVEQWLRSRKRFRGGKYISEHMMAHGLANEAEVLEKWRSDWTSHEKRVREMAEDGRIRLLEYSLNTEKPSRFFARLEDMLKQDLRR